MMDKVGERKEDAGTLASGCETRVDGRTAELLTIALDAIKCSQRDAEVERIYLN